MTPKICNILFPLFSWINPLYNTWNISRNCLTECWLTGDWMLTDCWLIVDCLGTDKKIYDANVFDWLQRSLTNAIRHYLDNRQPIDQSINDVQHNTDLYISKIATSQRNYAAVNLFNINDNRKTMIVKVIFFVNLLKCLVSLNPFRPTIIY